MRAFFIGTLDDPLPTLTPERAKALAEKLLRDSSPRTGRARKASSLRTIWSAAKSFFKWCAASRRLPVDPFLVADAKMVAELQHALRQARTVLEATAKQRDEALAQLHAVGGAR